MSLSKVTSDNGSSLARFTADHAAVPLLGAPLPNSPDGSKDYVWAAVHILGVSIVAGSNAFACGPLLGKSDMHAAVLNKVLLHYARSRLVVDEKENTRKSQWAPHRVRSSDGASPISPPQKLGRPRVSSR